MSRLRGVMLLAGLLVQGQDLLEWAATSSREYFQLRHLQESEVGAGWVGELSTLDVLAYLPSSRVGRSIRVAKLFQCVAQFDLMSNVRPTRNPSFLLFAACLPRAVAWPFLCVLNFMLFLALVVTCAGGGRSIVRGQAVIAGLKALEDENRNDAAGGDPKRADTRVDSGRASARHAGPAMEVRWRVDNLVSSYVATLKSDEGAVDPAATETDVECCPTLITPKTYAFYISYSLSFPWHGV